MPDSVDNQPAAPDHHPPSLVVGIGASAGGIRALQRFFARVPADSGAAYVVILHLSPSHESKLAEVLQAVTPLPVSQVAQSTRIEADRVYVISPNQTLEMVDGMLVVSAVSRPEGRRAPVDIFFRTLSDSHGSDAVCVVLSGTGPDGSSGLKRVKESGGLVVAQEPSDAEYADMPRNAIATGLVDYVLPADEIPSAILAYQQRSGKRERPLSSDTAATAAPVTADVDAAREIVGLLRARTGQDFSSYKTATLNRRIERRIHVHNLASAAEYARLMRDRPSEASALMKELLISVTHFFRDPDSFAALEQRVIPRLFEGKRSQDQVRVWAAGCATGEEAYSLAVLVAEAASRLADPPIIQVFASDLDEQAIATAREGVYSIADVADISEERLRRFFQKDAGGYRVRRDLRELVLFAHHNVIKDPPFSHLDLIVCRNLLIYLNRSMQDRLVRAFHYALRPGGFLFLGTSETPEGANELFITLDKDARIYERRPVVSRRPSPPEVDGLESALPIPHQPPDLRPVDRILPAELHHRLLEQYAPPSIVVTEDYQIVHMSDRAGVYLQIGGGEPSQNLLKLARRELRTDLTTALQAAGRQRSNVETKGVRVKGPAGDTYITLMVRPVLREGDPARGFFLVLFQDEGETRQPRGNPDVELLSVGQSTTGELEDELARTNAQLRGMIEQYESQVEASKAANEELQAMNEELRSAAEELETSKEELQSVNEELTTVNQEFKIKIEELSLTNNDFQNLLRSTEIGTIFLDRSLRVKLSTPRAHDVFNLLATDIGRPLSDITDRLLSPGLHEDVVYVLDHLQAIEREVGTNDGRWYQMRLLPYRTMDDRIDGVVITFQEITARRRAELQVRASEERLRLLIDSAIDYAIFTIGLDGRVDSWNVGAQRMFGYASDEIVGHPFAELFTPEDRAAGVPDKELRTAAADGRAGDERWHLRKDGSRLYCTGVTSRLGEREYVGFAKIARDLTADRRAEDTLERLRSELEDRVRQRTAHLEAEVSEQATAQIGVLRLVRMLVAAQEDERARIARDLHDQLGQQLTALRLSLEQHRDRYGIAMTDDEPLARALALSSRIDADVDFLAWELRPPALDDLGLLSALPRFVDEWAKHYGLAAEFRTAGFGAGQLSRQAELVFYRVAQEGLNNIVKHAQATRVDVILETYDNSVVLVIEDDGIGFDPADQANRDKGIGVIGMHERAALIGASLEVESTPGKGTTIFLRQPVQHSDGQGS